MLMDEGFLFVVFFFCHIHTLCLFEQVGKFYMTQNYRKCFHILIKITFMQYLYTGISIFCMLCKDIYYIFFLNKMYLYLYMCI
jgi:hypothetical protein